MEIFEIVKLAVTTLVPTGLLYSWMKRKYAHWKKGREMVAGAQKAINESFEEKLKSIREQVNPNGGLSMNDAVVRIEKRLGSIDNQLVDLKIGQRNTLDLMDIAYWESDNEGRVTYVSVAMCEILGCTQIDILDSSWMGLIDSEDRSRVIHEWSESVKFASEFNCTYNYRRPDGQYQRVQAVAIHHKNNDGKVDNTKGKIIKIGEPFKK
jgi:PAS domain S-box-containing protein